MASELERSRLGILLEDARITIELLGASPPSARQAARVSAMLARVEHALEGGADHLRTLLAADMTLTANRLETLHLRTDGAVTRCLRSCLNAVAGVAENPSSEIAIPVCSPLALSNELRALRAAPLLSGNVVFASAVDADDGLDDSDTIPLDDPNLAATARRLRSFYQQGLVAWLRGADSGAAARRLGDVFARIESRCLDSPQERLWRLARPFAEVLEDQGWRTSAAVKRVLGQLDGQLKRLADEGGPAFIVAPSPALMRTLLYYISVARNHGPGIVEARSRYRLETAFAVPTRPVEPTAVLALLHELLAISSTLMEALAPDGSWPAKRSLLVERLLHAADGLGLMDFHDGRHRAMQEVDLLQATPSSGDPPPDGWGQMAERLHAIGVELLSAAGMEPAAALPERDSARAEGGLLTTRLEADLVHAEAVIRRLERDPPAQPDGESARVAAIAKLAPPAEEFEDSAAALRERLERLSQAMEEHVAARAADSSEGDGEEGVATDSADGELLDEISRLAGEIDAARSRLEQQVGAFREGLQDMGGVIRVLKEELDELRADTETAGSLGAGARKGATGAPHGTSHELADMGARLEQLSRRVSDLSALRGAIESLAGESRSVLVQQARDSLALEQRLMHTRTRPLDTQLEVLRRDVSEGAARAGKQVVLELHASGLRIEPEKLARLIPVLRSLLEIVIRHGVERPHERVLAGSPPGCPLEAHFKRRGADLDVRLLADCPSPPPAAFSDVETRLRPLAGRLELDTQDSPPTRCALRVPLAPQVATVLQVEVGGETYALPLAEVEAVLQAPAQGGGSPQPGVVRHAGKAWQMVDLGALLALERKARRERPGRVPVVLVAADGERRALTVDAIGDRADVVVRSVGIQLRSLVGLAGATILGDGQVVLILDVSELVRIATPSDAPSEALETSS